ncbi:MAG: DUF3015 family protein [Nevskiaceae bacterium]
MSKRLIAVTVLALAPLAPAMADNDAGCGLGTQVMAGKSGIFAHLVATYTNGLLGNQTFGITSGTLGCNGNSEVTADADLRKFASTNLDQLTVEMATGEGEALTALASLYGIEAQDRAAFYSLTKSNYGTIVDSDSVTAGEVLASIRTLMAADARLSRYVA